MSIAITIFFDNNWSFSFVSWCRLLGIYGLNLRPNWGEFVNSLGIGRLPDRVTKSHDVVIWPLSVRGPLIWAPHIHSVNTHLFSRPPIPLIGDRLQRVNHVYRTKIIVHGVNCIGCFGFLAQHLLLQCQLRTTIGLVQGRVNPFGSPHGSGE